MTSFVIAWQQLRVASDAGQIQSIDYAQRMSSNVQKQLVCSLLPFFIRLPSACTFISLSMPSDTYSDSLGLLSNKVSHFMLPQLDVDIKETKIFSSTKYQQKLEDVFKAVDDVNWVLGEFLRLHFGCHLPEIETLEEAARKLHHAYSSTRGVYHALHEMTETTTWCQTVPLGTPWVPPPTFESSEGDANSIMFVRDAMISREMSYAIAEGEAGRVYEVRKVMLFTFAGSSHSKYTTYLLKTICNLEMESGPALRDTKGFEFDEQDSTVAASWCIVDSITRLGGWKSVER
ncbi:hypothetical protein JOM56_013881 [Amanita muscaria]